MENLSDIRVIKKILRKHGFNFSKSMGQNFLVNSEVCPRMAKACGANENTGVLEIGPGIGVLTTELAKRAKKVVSIELDKRLIPILNESLSEFNNVKVINADFMKLNLNDLLTSEFKNMNVVVCANLPYYITSPIIMKLLEDRVNIKSVTVMVQKEVADRICAGDCNRNASAIGLAVNYYSKPELLFTVDRNSFMPSPNVNSAVLKLTIRKEPDFNVDNEKLFFKIIKSAFLQRRKTIMNSLNNSLNVNKDELKLALEQANIEITSRAENISLKQFAKLSNVLDDKIKL